MTSTAHPPAATEPHSHAATTLNAGRRRAALIPRKVLFAPAERMHPTLSPDGCHVAYLAPLDGVVTLWVHHVDSGAARPLLRRDQPLRVSPWWAPDSKGVLFLDDADGNENYHLFHVPLTTGQALSDSDSSATNRGSDPDAPAGSARDLTPLPGVTVRPLAISAAVPDAVLIAMNHPNPQLFDVYRIELADGARRQLTSNPGVLGWSIDAHLNIVAALHVDADGGHSVLRVTGQDVADWQPILTTGPAAGPLTLLPATADGSRVHVLTAANRDAAALRSVPVTGQQLSDSTVLLANSTYDVELLKSDPLTWEPQLGAVGTATRRTVHALRPDVSTDLTYLQQQDGGDLILPSSGSATADDRRWLVGFARPDGPIRYVLFDRDNKHVRELFTSSDLLARQPLAPVTSLSFTARDGLTITGYLTWPRSHKPDGPTNTSNEHGADTVSDIVGGSPNRAEPLPLVVLVHGGPAERDTWRFDPEAQWLANRGYLVAQVNFRGSSGFGRAFRDAGNREWGRAMQHDLNDAVAHLVQRGLVDPSRVGIMGASYGGYAALAGATDPEKVFSCAIDVCGPSDLATLVNGIPSYWVPLRRQLVDMVGDPDTEPDFVAERSPLKKAGTITIPVLIAQGANDPRVPVNESEQLVDALRAKGIPFTYLLFDDEGHGFTKPANVMRFREHAERFLAEHLGGVLEDDEVSTDSTIGGDITAMPAP